MKEKYYIINAMAYNWGRGNFILFEPDPYYSAELNQAKLSYAITTDNRTSFTLCLPRADNSMIEI